MFACFGCTASGRIKATGDGDTEDDRLKVRVHARRSIWAHLRAPHYSLVSVLFRPLQVVRPRFRQRPWLFFITPPSPSTANK